MSVKTQKTEEKIIDATGQILGRLASRAAYELAGKRKAGFHPAKRNPTPIKIINASKVKTTGQKMKQKVYRRYTGYPSGIKEMTFEEKMKKDPASVIRKAVWGMLAKNKSRKHVMKYLTVIA